MSDEVLRPDEQVTALEYQARSIAQRSQALIVVDDASYVQAGEDVKLADEYARRVGEVLDPIVKAADAAHKVAVAQRAKLLGPAMAAKRSLLDRMAGYRELQRRKREDADRAARLERERLEAEERERAEAATRRLQAEAEDRRLAEAAALEASGDLAAAEKLLEAPVEAPTVRAMPVFVPSPPVVLEPPRVPGVSFREEWDFEVIDPDRIPREYLAPDLVAIRRVVRAMKAGTRIPGIRVFPKPVGGVRS